MNVESLETQNKEEITTIIPNRVIYVVENRLKERLTLALGPWVSDKLLQHLVFYIYSIFLDELRIYNDYTVRAFTHNTLIFDHDDLGDKLDAVAVRTAHEMLHSVVPDMLNMIPGDYMGETEVSYDLQEGKL